MPTTEPPNPTDQSPSASVEALRQCDATSEQISNKIVALRQAFDSGQGADGAVVPGLSDEVLGSEEMEQIIFAILHSMIGDPPAEPRADAQHHRPTPFYLFTYNPHVPASSGLLCRASAADALLQVYNVQNDPARGGAFPDLAVTRTVATPTTPAPPQSGELDDGEARQGESDGASAPADATAYHTERAIYPWPFHVVDLSTGACWHQSTGPKSLDCEHFGLPMQPHDLTPVSKPQPVPRFVAIGQRTGAPMPRAVALARSLGREVADYGPHFGADVFGDHLPGAGSWGAWCVYGWVSLSAEPCDSMAPGDVLTLNNKDEIVVTAWLAKGASWLVEINTGRVFACEQAESPGLGLQEWVLRLEGTVENADPLAAYLDQLEFYSAKQARFLDLLRLVNLLNLLADWKAAWMSASKVIEAPGDWVEAVLPWPDPVPVPSVQGVAQPAPELVDQLTEARRRAVLRAVKAATGV